MGANPRTSVVDPNLRVHGTKNLFVAGSSVFVTSGTANPTLTFDGSGTQAFGSSAVAAAKRRIPKGTYNFKTGSAPCGDLERTVKIYESVR